MMSAVSSKSMKRIASPKMRHVRALSPYARQQDEGFPDNRSLGSYINNAGAGARSP